MGVFQVTRVEAEQNNGIFKLLPLENTIGTQTLNQLGGKV